MIRNRFKSIVFYFGKSLSYFFQKRTDCVAFSWKRRLYSGWISRDFREFGKNSTVDPKFRLLKGAKHISIGDRTHFGKDCVLTAWDRYKAFMYSPTIVIGDGCNFGDYNHITSINRIEIGNNVLTGRWVTISDNGHGRTDYKSLQTPPRFREIVSKGPVIIGDNVWIGDKATILSGVTVGEGAVIGANTVVTKDIPPYSVAVGNPVRIIKRCGEISAN